VARAGVVRVEKQRREQGKRQRMAKGRAQGQWQQQRQWCCGDIGGRLTGSGGRGGGGMAWVARQGTFLRVRCGWRRVVARAEKHRRRQVQKGVKKGGRDGG